MLTSRTNPYRQTLPEAGAWTGTTAMTCPRRRLGRLRVAAVTAIAFALPAASAGVASVMGPPADVEVAVTDGTSNT